MHPTITPIDGTSFGAVVTGIELARLDDPTWRLVEAAFHEHAALIFPGQFLSDDAQIAFGRRFGELEIVRENIPVKAKFLNDAKNALAKIK